MRSTVNAAVARQERLAPGRYGVAVPAETDVLHRLTAATGVYRGRGDGPESGPFMARMVVGTALDGRAAILDYEATTDSDGLRHVEHSVLVLGAGGRLELHVASLELPGMVRFTQRSPGQFTAYEGPLVARIVLTTPRPEAISYAWWWSRDEREPREQSRADLFRTG
ncbi:hypothetical protein [Plantactinospora sp. BB1]|uniref:hypothetical protein n=1 Tax=Plantactinospora sp. BB1 TaxID=2071627 RepID=UPI000D158787|nr:hypothetical protein [Plantactinospora sp. BB1]AVT38938.1 hypothetical protein C6W10_23685 [Plantactinospora sp. BB1]